MREWHHKQIIPNAATVVACLDLHTTNDPNRDAFIFIKEAMRPETAVTFSYDMLQSEAKRIGQWLLNNFPAESRILLLFPSGPEFVTSFYGCLYAGMIAVPAPLPGLHIHHQRRLKNIVQDCGVTTVLTDAVHLETIATWLQREALVTIDCNDVNTLKDESKFPWPKIKAHQTALLQYTSGSTSQPKGVVITHHNILHNVASFGAALGFDQNTRFGSWLPLYHDMGLLAQLLPPLILGSTCILMAPTAFLMRPHSWLRMLDFFKVNHTAAPNFAFEYCMRRITPEQMTNVDLSCLKFLINGSEPIHADTLKLFADKFSRAGLDPTAIRPCYGLAESTVFAAGCSKREPHSILVDTEHLARGRVVLAQGPTKVRKLVSCGLAIGSDLRIVNPHTLDEEAEGLIGEIWIKGDSLTSGYWGHDSHPSMNAMLRSGEGGFFRTGDLGALLNSELYVTGRSKEMMIVAGRNLYPQDLEFEMRQEFPALQTKIGAAFSIEIPGEGEAIIIAHEVNGNPAISELQDLGLKIKDLAFKVFGIKLSGILLLRSGSVQRTTSGKIERNTMRARFIGGELQVLWSDVETNVRNMIPVLTKDH